MMQFLFFFIAAYLIGSISVAILACRLMGLPDPRTQGSGNPGATNVMRFAGKKLAVIVLIGDILKGAIPVLAAKLSGIPIELLAWITLAAFLGHLFPLFFRFQGGKGVATGFGGIVVTSWPLGLSILGVWILVAVTTRYSSLAAIAAALALAVLSFYFLPLIGVWPMLILTVLLIYKHMDNLRRLVGGEEGRIGG